MTLQFNLFQFSNDNFRAPNIEKLRAMRQKSLESNQEPGTIRSKSNGNVVARNWGQVPRIVESNIETFKDLMHAPFSVLPKFGQFLGQVSWDPINRKILFMSSEQQDCFNGPKSTILRNAVANHFQQWFSDNPMGSFHTPIHTFHDISTLARDKYQEFEAFLASINATLIFDVVHVVVENKIRQNSSIKSAKPNAFALALLDMIPNDEKADNIPIHQRIETATRFGISNTNPCREVQTWSEFLDLFQTIRNDWNTITNGYYIRDKLGKMFEVNTINWEATQEIMNNCSTNMDRIPDKHKDRFIELIKLYAAGPIG